MLRRPNSSIKMCLKECLVLQSTPSQSLIIAVLPYLKYFVLPLPLCPTVLGYICITGITGGYIGVTSSLVLPILLLCMCVFICVYYYYY